MNQEQFYAGIGLSEEARRFVRENPLEDEEYIGWRNLFYRDLDGFFYRLSERPDPNGEFLRISLRMAMDCRAEYQRMGIPDSVFLDTFSDISVWEEECRNRTGHPGVAESGWISRHLSLAIFRLGRLQFEPIALQEPLSLDGFQIPAGQLALNVHIPKLGPLLPEETAASYRMAERFFRGVPPLFLCASWLLSPALEQLLSPTSNILAFQREYRIVRLLPESRQAEERIFGEILDEPENYPEETSLQKAAKRHLLSGEKLASAFGVRFPAGDSASNLYRGREKE